MTLFDYLNIKEFNLLTDNLYAYGDKLIMLKHKFIVDNISEKLLTRNQPLSQQLNLPITLIDTPIPIENQIPHIIIKNKSNEIIYSEHIIEKTNRYLAINNEHNLPELTKIRGLMLRWQFHGIKSYFNTRPTDSLLKPTHFNTVYPDGSKFNITKL